ncbi:MAG: TolC family protein [Flavobacteriaceae bacterium]|nr:TolC family protein [Flavobacteriaceae bacterium]
MNAALYGQEENQEKNPNKLVIPPLTVLIDSALVNNKMLEYRKLEIDAKTLHAKSKARNWTRYMGFQGGAQYGVFDNFSTSDQVNITSNDLNSSLLQWNFNVGVFIKIPIFGIINNKTHNDIAAVEIEQAKHLHLSLIDEITEDVIRLYEDLILRQELLEINSKNYANGRVNYEMIQKEFENGQISVTEYVRISDVITKLTIEYEKSKTYFFQAKKLLENKVGFKIK